MTPLRAIRPGRLAALAIPTVLLAAAGGLILHAWLSSRHDREIAVERSLKAFDVYRRSAADRASLERELQALRTGQSSAPGLLPGASAPLAAAGLQGEVKRIVEAAGGEIKSAQTIAAAPAADGLEKIEVRYSVMASLAGAAEMMARIESHTPYLFLDQLELRAPEGAGDAKAADPKLTVRWIVYGYRWTGAK